MRPVGDITLGQFGPHVFQLPDGSFLPENAVPSGLVANRPPAAQGSAYFATDQHILYVSDGSTWTGYARQVTFGTLGSRPAASGGGSLYLATDVGPSPGTVYADTGSWQAAAGTSEIASAESTSNFTTTSTTAVDVTGMSLATFTVGDRPFYVCMSCQAQNNTLGDSVIVQVVESVNGGAYSVINLGGAQPASIGQQSIGVPIALQRRRSFARGTTVAYKLQAYAVGGGTATVFGAASNPISLYAWQA
jgi:hypothetical protein